MTTQRYAGLFIDDIMTWKLNLLHILKEAELCSAQTAGEHVCPQQPAQETKTSETR